MPMNVRALTVQHSPLCGRFLATEKGGHLSEANGQLVRKWKWPQANVKITEPITFQVFFNTHNQIVS